MGKLSDIFKDWKVIILIVFLLFALFYIKPQIFGNDGVAIKSVMKNSSAELAGIQNPSAKLRPLGREVIIAINNKPVADLREYYDSLLEIEENKTIRVTTDKKTYTLLPPPGLISASDRGSALGLRVGEAPSSNLKKGLDLEGGTRVVLKPTTKISADDLEITIQNLQERLNVFGLSDVVIKSASDLAGDSFIVIEIAGVTEDEVKELLAKQGKFEAKIGNDTVFFGGKKDVTYVCRSADCSGIDPNTGCSAIEGGSICRFFFSITLSNEAAERQAELTKDLPVVNDQQGSYLQEPLTLYLDDEAVDTLNIGAELKGRATTNIQISGSGQGRNQQEAINDALHNMKRLQTIIITGSLPVKLDVVKMDTLSPTLGKEFLTNLLLIGVLAIVAVVLVIMIRYRNMKIALPMALVLLSEQVLILGFAALVGWNLDLAAITGIIIVVGTGVDHLIMITDEVLKGEATSDWKRKIKQAMFIVMGAYLTTLSGMVPLWFAGAGLLKGFAFTTIAGLSFGVLIARPAYAAMIQHILKE